MPRIYSNAFFHYTTKEGLLGILKEGFKASYCKEQFKDNAGNLQYIGIPMISFCDIPLSLISQILYGEGKYAIGMKRTWGIRKGLTPVLYYSNNENSMITKSISDSCSKFYTNEINNKTLKYKILGISKPMRKYKVDKPNQETDNYREREWRKVFYREKWKNEIEYEKWRGKGGKPFLNDKLIFKPTDIEFIITENDSIASELIEQILGSKFTICGSHVPPQEQYELISKIITKQKIEENF